MLFNSLEFVLFLVVSLFAYYSTNKKPIQVGVLIASSFIFYSWHDAHLTLLLVLSVLINAISSYLVVTHSQKKLWAWLGVTTNLLVLVYFKYAGLFAKTLLSQSFLDGEFGKALISLPLPIGISFFTFQGISLVVDVYRGNYDKKIGALLSFPSHFVRTSLFIAFFPSLIAGPIVKAHDFYYQIVAKKLSNINWEAVVKALVLGYFLKCVVADNLKEQTFWITYPYFKTISSLDLVTLLVAYSAQIFADFAGYSYIAIGLGHLYGYNLIKNFDWPYISSSFSEFWRRWHISLSTFLKEYLYIPLGGNRKGEFRTYFNLFIVMFLGGLWHGAAWSYAVWGIAHGVALAIERFFGFEKSATTEWGRLLKILAVFSYVTLAWLLFKLPNFEHVVEYLSSIYDNLTILSDKKRLFICFVYSLPVFLLHIAYFYKERIDKYWNVTVEAFVYAAMLFLILTSLGSSGEFIYFQF